MTESRTPVADALAVVDQKQSKSGQNGELTALRALAEAVRVHLLARPEANPLPTAVTPARGECEWCETAGAELVAALASDTEAYVCASCHADARVPTVSLAALRDERPVLVITRGDLARWAWRDLTDAEVSQVSKSIDHAEVARRVQDVVFGVCGTPSALAALTAAAGEGGNEVCVSCREREAVSSGLCGICITEAESDCDD